MTSNIATNTKAAEWLQQIRIAKPCAARWDDMVGDERSRFCIACKKNVYNFSAMTAAEAQDLIRENEGRLCGRIYRRRDGTVLTADCPVGVAWARTRVVFGLCSAAAVAVFAVSSLAGVQTNTVTQLRMRLVATIEQKITQIKAALGFSAPQRLLGEAIAGKVACPPPQNSTSLVLMGAPVLLRATTPTRPPPAINN